MGHRGIGGVAYREINFLLANKSPVSSLILNGSESKSIPSHMTSGHFSVKVFVNLNSAYLCVIGADPTQVSSQAV